MSGHTEGPWKVGPRNAGDGANISDSIGRYLAHTSAVRNLDGRRIHPARSIEADEALANARLIATAPQMLEALKTTLGNLKSLKGNAFRNLDTLDEWIAVVEAAIANAEGRS